MNVIRKLYLRQIALVVAFSMLIIGAIPARSMAYMLGAGPAVQAATQSTRAEDMAKVQRVLESKLVAGKLQAAGLTPSEVKTRLQKLSNADLHQFASRIDNLYAGGDFGVVIGLLVIVILVLVILKLMDRKIVLQ